MSIRDWFVRVCCVGLFLAGAGCGGPRLVPVKGAITLEGKPLKDATVTFTPEGNGRVATGYTDNEGNFELGSFTTGDGAYPGDYKVTITVEKSLPHREGGGPPTGRVDFLKIIEQQKKVMQQETARKGWGSVPNKDPRGPKAIYGDITRTPLKCRVPPAGAVTFKLQSEGGK